MELNEEVKIIIDKILLDPKNIASPNELNQQARACLSALERSDLDQNNMITFDEINKLTEILGLPIQNEESFDVFDTDGSGALENIEFLEWWLRRISVQPGNTKQQEVLARNTFNTFDKDNSGSINIEEFNNLVNSLGVTFTEQELIDSIKELDQDGSGYIELNEFISWWINRTQNVHKGGGLISYKLKKLINKAAQMYQTDIFTATWNHQINLVKMFLDSEPTLVNSLDRSEYGNEWSILHYASYKGYEDLVQLILSIPGVQVNIKNIHGFTPLFYSAQQNYENICLLLLNSGADPSISGYDDTLDNDFYPPMSPVDHIIDSPSLLSIFQQHEKVIPPKNKPNITSSKLSLNGILLIDISNYLNISHLPINSWKINFYIQSDFIFHIELKYYKLSNYNSNNVQVIFQPAIDILEKLIKSVGKLSINERYDSLELDLIPNNIIGEGQEASSSKIKVDLSEILDSKSVHKSVSRSINK